LSTFCHVCLSDSIDFLISQINSSISFSIDFISKKMQSYQILLMHYAAAEYHFWDLIMNCLVCQTESMEKKIYVILVDQFFMYWAICCQLLTSLSIVAVRHSGDVSWISELCKSVVALSQWSLNCKQAPVFPWHFSCHLPFCLCWDSSNAAAAFTFFL
jgi:hypothetical protein